MEHPKAIGETSQLAIMLGLDRAGYAFETKGVYLVPIEHVRVRREGALRVDPTRNGQAHKVRLAADYQIAQI